MATSRREVLWASGDGVGGVPATRWVIEGAVDARAWSADHEACAQHGGFVAAVQRFDNRAFGISPAEAAAMDPQQRLLLEQGYTALHASCQRRSTLMHGSSAVCLGIERPDWALLQALRPGPHDASAYGATADTISVACGRLSFVLGL